MDSLNNLDLSNLDAQLRAADQKLRQQCQQIEEEERQQRVAEAQRLTALNDVRVYLNDSRTAFQEELLRLVGCHDADLAAEAERQVRIASSRLQVVNAEWMDRCGKEEYQSNQADRRNEVQEALLHRVNGLEADLAAQNEREARVQQERMQSVLAEWLDRCGKTMPSPVHADRLNMVHTEWLTRCGKYEFAMDAARDVEEQERAARIAADYRLVNLNDRQIDVQEDLMRRVNGLKADYSAQVEREVRMQEDRMKAVSAQWLHRCGQDVFAQEALGLEPTILMRNNMSWAQIRSDRMEMIHEQIHSVSSIQYATQLEEQARTLLISEAPTSTAGIFMNDRSTEAKAALQEELCHRVNGLAADLACQYERDARIQANRLKEVHAEWMDRCGKYLLLQVKQCAHEDRRMEVQEELCHRVNGLLADLAYQHERDARMQADRLKKVNAEWLDRCGVDMPWPVSSGKNQLQGSILNLG